MEEHRERFSKNKILVISIENAKIPDSGVAVLANVSDPSSSCVNEIDVSLDALNLNSVCFSCFISNDACRDTVDLSASYKSWFGEEEACKYETLITNVGDGSCVGSLPCTELIGRTVGDESCLHYEG